MSLRVLLCPAARHRRSNLLDLPEKVNHEEATCVFQNKLCSQQMIVLHAKPEFCSVCSFDELLRNACFHFLKLKSVSIFFFFFYLIRFSFFPFFRCPFVVMFCCGISFMQNFFLSFFLKIDCWWHSCFIWQVFVSSFRLFFSDKTCSAKVRMSPYAFLVHAFFSLPALCE